MAPIKAKVFRMVRHFNGEPKPSDFAIKEEVLPPLREGDVLLEAVWLSVDPYMRSHMPLLPAGSKMIGYQVAKVLDSRHKDYSIGDHVLCSKGWASLTVCNPDDEMKVHSGRFRKIEPSKTLPLSYSLGVLGSTGVTAYFGFLELCAPKPGDTVVVSGAGGAVGSVVGQIAKIKGCRTIGFAGTDEKVEWLRTVCKFDFAYNYKKTNTVDALREAAPDGVDCYFDNVGGTFSSDVLSMMKEFSHVSVCGSISTYNSTPEEQAMAPTIQQYVLRNQVKMEGFLSNRWADRYPEALKELQKWVTEGQIVVLEKVYEGFENMPQAFIGMLRGDNIGKAVVKV